MARRIYERSGRPSAPEETKLSERVQTRLTVADRQDFNNVIAPKAEVWMIRKVMLDYIDTHKPLSTGNALLDSSRLALAGEMIRSANWQRLNLSVAVSIIRLLHESGALENSDIHDWLYDEDTESLRSREEIEKFRYQAEVELFGE